MLPSLSGMLFLWLSVIAGSVFLVRAASHYFDERSDLYRQGTIAVLVVAGFFLICGLQLL